MQVDSKRVPVLVEDEQVLWEIGSTGPLWAWKSTSFLVPPGAFRLHLVGGNHINVDIRGVSFESTTGSCDIIDTSWLSFGHSIPAPTNFNSTPYFELEGGITKACQEFGFGPGGLNV